MEVGGARKERGGSRGKKWSIYEEGEEDEEEEQQKEEHGEKMAQSVSGGTETRLLEYRVKWYAPDGQKQPLCLICQ